MISPKFSVSEIVKIFKAKTGLAMCKKVPFLDKDKNDQEVAIDDIKYIELKENNNWAIEFKKCYPRLKLRGVFWTIVFQSNYYLSESAEAFFLKGLVIKAGMTGREETVLLLGKSMRPPLLSGLW